MKKRKLVLAILSIGMVYTAFALNPAHTPSQKEFRTIPARTDFGSYPIEDASSSEDVAAFITHQSANLQSKVSGLTLEHSSSSLAAYHYTFTQTYNGIPVYASSITVNASKKNVVFSVFDGSYDLSKWKVATVPFDYQRMTAYQTYVKLYFLNDKKEIAKQSIAYVEQTKTPVFCYDVTISDMAGHQRELLISIDGIIYEHDMTMHYTAPDSTVTGMVFSPDPLTTAHVPWSGVNGLYDNHNDSDVVVLNAQRQLVHFKANYDSISGIFSLSNKYIQEQGFGGTGIYPVTSTTPDFSFMRSNSGFEDVMVFYHLNVMRSYIHDLGFTCADTFVVVDPDGNFSDDSHFTVPMGGSLPQINFGTGGVPDAQDADVVIHEYTHFLSWRSNGTNSGGSNERLGLDEGMADYNGASYSKGIDPYNSDWFFNFDGHNEYWDGRIVNDMTVYPSLPTAYSVGGTIYAYGTLWASAMMTIWGHLGRGVTDSLAYEAMYSFGGNTTLPEAAQMVVDADCQLFNGAHFNTLWNDFRLHGLGSNLKNCQGYPAAVNDISDPLSAITFISRPESFRVLVPQSEINFRIDIYDMTGQKISSYQNVTADIIPSLPNGIYAIDVSSGGVHRSFKWALVR
jgi:hypothetical protein